MTVQGRRTIGLTVLLALLWGAGCSGTGPAVSVDASLLGGNSFDASPMEAGPDASSDVRRDGARSGNSDPDASSNAPEVARVAVQLRVVHAAAVDQSSRLDFYRPGDPVPIAGGVGYAEATAFREVAVPETGATFEVRFAADRPTTRSRYGSKALGKVSKGDRVTVVAAGEIVPFVEPAGVVPPGTVRFRFLNSVQNGVLQADGASAVVRMRDAENGLLGTAGYLALSPAEGAQIPAAAGPGDFSRLFVLRNENLASANQDQPFGSFDLPGDLLQSGHSLLGIVTTISSGTLAPLVVVPDEGKAVTLDHVTKDRSATVVVVNALADLPRGDDQVSRGAFVFENASGRAVSSAVLPFGPGMVNAYLEAGLTGMTLPALDGEIKVIGVSPSKAPDFSQPGLVSLALRGLLRNESYAAIVAGLIESTDPARAPRLILIDYGSATSLQNCSAQQFKFVHAAAQAAGPIQPGTVNEDGTQFTSLGPLLAFGESSKEWIGGLSGSSSLVVCGGGAPPAGSERCADGQLPAIGPRLTSLGQCPRAMAFIGRAGGLTKTPFFVISPQ